MRVIENGKFFLPIGQCRCEFCNCLYEYNPKDVQTAWKNNHTEPFYTYVECPECGERVILKDF